MNIKRAKAKEIKNTVKAYLAQDENGRYKIDSIKQRPILLIGPPGIGKTAIMEQVARESVNRACCLYHDPSYKTECNGGFHL